MRMLVQTGRQLRAKVGTVDTAGTGLATMKRNVALKFVILTLPS